MLMLKIAFWTIGAGLVLLLLLICYVNLESWWCRRGYLKLEAERLGRCLYCKRDIGSLGCDYHGQRHVCKDDYRCCNECFEEHKEEIAVDLERERKCWASLSVGESSDV